MLSDRWMAGFLVGVAAVCCWSASAVRAQAAATRGTLEIVVRDHGSRKPIEGADINIRSVESVEWFQGKTGGQGILRMQLPAGTYGIERVFLFGSHSSARLPGSVDIEVNKVQRVEIFLMRQPTLRGRVLDEAGDPIGGASIRVLPISPREATTDGEGRFEISWDAMEGGEETLVRFDLVARHVERNLAGVVEIKDADESIEVVLGEGVTVEGRVVDAIGKGISGAKVYLNLEIPGGGGPISNYMVLSDGLGRYRIPAVPKGFSCVVSAGADGYGRGRVVLSADSFKEPVLKVEAISLEKADLVLSGRVVDGEGRAVRDVWVFGFGDDQPFSQAVTDSTGRFTLRNLCRGTVHLRAGVRDKNLFGRMTAQAGEKDVRFVLEAVKPVEKAVEDSTSRPMLGNLEPFRAGVDRKTLAGKRVLVCFWDVDVRPSREMIAKLSESSDRLKQQDVSIVSVHAGPVAALVLKEWILKLDVPFPVGMVQREPEAVLSVWGVRGIPWLILTDGEHRIIGEGFGFEDLDAFLVQPDRGSEERKGF